MAKVEIEIGADGRAFIHELDKMKHHAHGFGEHLQGLASKIAAGFGAERIIEHVVEAVGEAVSSYKDFAVEVSRTTALLGENADEVQRVAFAAKMANADFSELQKGMLMLRKTQADAAKGSPDALETFANLQIDPEKFGAAKLSEQVLMLADSFAKLSEKGDPAQLFLNALGTKNRALIQMIAEGRHQLEHEMAETPITDTSSEDAARKVRVHHEAELRSKIADSGLVESQDQMHELAAGLGGTFMEAGARLYDTAIDTARMFGIDDGEETRDTKRRRALMAKLGVTQAGQIPELRVRHGLGEASETEPAEHGDEHDSVAPDHDGHSTPKLPRAHQAPVPVLFGTASKRAAMSESEREMDFRNEQLLVLDPGDRAAALKAEQLRILSAATKETDPDKAHGLLLKGKGMESEIVAAMRAANDPMMLHVSASKLAEMGGGGPQSTFGGVELKIDKTNDLLRDIRDRMGGSGGNFIWSNGNTTGNPDADRAGTFPLARILPSVPGFDHE